MGEQPFTAHVEVTPISGALTHMDRVFTYGLPPGMECALGAVVRVPVRGRPTLGVVTGFDEAPPGAVKAVRAVVGPGLPPDAVDLAGWIAGRYLSTLGEALAAMVPQRVAGEEDAPPPSAHESRPPVPADALTDLDRAGDILDALATGSPGGFVVRPPTARPRGALVAALADAALRAGRGVLVLVPDVKVGGTVAAVLEATFGDAIARLDSARSARERYRAWLALRTGLTRIAIGGRAAVFAPVPELGLIIVDDEGHPSYKEGRAPRFHARAVAAERARLAGATVVLIGMPPTVEARAACERGPYQMVLPLRAIERASRPAVRIVERTSGERLVPAAATMRAAADALADGGRVIVLSHRGGDALGRIAERAVRILRPRTHALVDASSTVASLRAAMARAQLIVCTPVMAKDIAAEGVTLVAIVEADAALVQPAFRAAEEAFAAWWRAAGLVRNGRILVETADPAQPALTALTRWDPEVLGRAEARRRRELRYPPYAALARIDVPSERAAAVAGEVGAAAPDLEVLGPVEDEGRAVLVVRAATRARLLAGLAPLAGGWRANDEPMRIDVDPWEVLVPKWRS